MFAAEMPIRQAYLNGMIPSQQRATVLSFDSLMGSTGGVVIQPVLGKSADVWSYATSYVIGAAFQVLAVPFLLLSRRENDAADSMVGSADRVPDRRPVELPCPPDAGLRSPVPEAYDRRLPLVAELAEGCRVEREVAAGSRLEPEPAGGQDPQQWPWAKTAASRSSSRSRATTRSARAPRRQRSRRLEHRRARASSPDARRGSPPCGAPRTRRSPTRRGRRELGNGAEAGQAGRLARPRERARQHKGESAPGEECAERLGVASTLLRQLDVRAAGVPAVAAPLGLAVADEDDLRRARSVCQIQPRHLNTTNSTTEMSTISASANG